ncbi:MAG: hypothetical protein RLN86_03125 [Cyclobacteriaceae bacterium]
MYIYRPLRFILIFLILLSCGRPLPTLDGINLDLWKKDKDGCEALRISDIENLRKEKEKLKRLTEMQVVELLGRPDESILLTRNQKFYHYYLGSGPNCAVPDPTALKLVLRFNAMGVLKETLIE